MPFAIGVVHLGNDADQRALCIDAPEDRQRVEHMAQHPGVGQHDDPARLTETDPVAGQVIVNVRPDGLGGVTEVVAGVEAGERP